MPCQTIYERTIGLDNPAICLKVRTSIVCLCVCVCMCVCICASLCLSGRFLMQIDVTLSSRNDVIAYVTWRHQSTTNFHSHRLTLSSLLGIVSISSTTCYTRAQNSHSDSYLTTCVIAYCAVRAQTNSQNFNFSLWNYLNINSIMACFNDRCTILRNKNFSCKWNCTKIKYTAKKYTSQWTHHVTRYTAVALIACLVHNISVDN